MSGERIYSVEVAIVRCPGDRETVAAAAAETTTVVRFCDNCRRWGPIGSTHLCWRNWHRRLSDLLIELARGGQR
jgi:hypothetical protein